MRAVVIALAFTMIRTQLASAQEARDVIAKAAQLPGWTDQFAGDLATMTGWMVDGSHRIDQGELILGGPGPVTLRMLDPLGDDFKLLIEYRLDASRPVEPGLMAEQDGFFGSTTHLRYLPGSNDGWTQVLLVQTPNPGGGHRLLRTIASDTLQMGGAGGAAIVEGNPVRRIDLVVEPGANLTVRRIRVMTVPPPARSSDSLVGPLAALGAVLGGVMVVGWLRQRGRRVVVLILIFGMVSGSALAQHNDEHDPAHGNARAQQGDAESRWVDQIGPGGLIGWNVRGGQIIDKDGVHLGGASPTTARLVERISDEFKLLIEYQSPNPQAIGVRFYRQGMFSGGFTETRLSPGGAGQWVDLTISGEFSPQSERYQITMHERHRNGESRSSSTRQGAIDWIEIEVPAGQLLTIRRLRLSNAVPASAEKTLYPAVAVLIVFLVGIMGLGWFLNRRRGAGS